MQILTHIIFLRARRVQPDVAAAAFQGKQRLDQNEVSDLWHRGRQHGTG